MLKALKDQLFEKWPLNRVVLAVTAFATPYVAVAAGLCSTWLVEHLPFIADQVGGPTQLTAIFISTALGAVAALVTAAYTWAKGWQFHEDRVWQEIHGVTGSAVEAPDEDLRRALQDKPPKS